MVKIADPKAFDSEHDAPPKARSRTQRSRVTNGSTLLPGVDGRSVWVRRCRDIIGAHLSDLPNATIGEKSLIRRAAVLTTELEQLEARFALAALAKQPARTEDLDLYVRAAGRLQSLLATVGLDRRSRPMGSIGNGKSGKPEAYSPLRDQLKRDAVIDVMPSEAAE